MYYLQVPITKNVRHFQHTVSTLTFQMGGMRIHQGTIVPKQDPYLEEHICISVSDRCGLWCNHSASKVHRCPPPTPSSRLAVACNFSWVNSAPSLQPSSVTSPGSVILSNLGYLLQCGFCFHTIIVISQNLFSETLTIMHIAWPQQLSETVEQDSILDSVLHLSLFQSQYNVNNSPKFCCQLEV